ncbi:hypothetical protein MRX96_009183 [Rhipicephalus microplus]
MAGAEWGSVGDNVHNWSVAEAITEADSTQAVVHSPEAVAKTMANAVTKTIASVTGEGAGGESVEDASTDLK